MSTVILSSPIGALSVTVDQGFLTRVSIGTSGAEKIAREQLDIGEGDLPLLNEAKAQINAWFAHRLNDFDLPLLPAKTTRGAVLRQAICEIAYGETASYGEVARLASSAARAIGQACRRNPFPIIVPCHRVVGSGQSIGYYSGGDGVMTKRWLLAHEQTNELSEG